MDSIKHRSVSSELREESYSSEDEFEAELKIRQCQGDSKDGELTQSPLLQTDVNVKPTPSSDGKSSPTPSPTMLESRKRPISKISGSKETNGRESKETWPFERGSDFIKPNADPFVATAETLVQGPIQNPFESFSFGSGTSPIMQTKSKVPLSFFTKNIKSPTKINKARENCLQAQHLEALSAEETKRLVEKWSSIIGQTGTDLETTRFQILVGVILSSRTRESVVRDGIASLRKLKGNLSMEVISSLNHQEISNCLSSIHYNNTKSKYIKDSTRVIANKFNGIVPQLESHLKELPGIGSALAKLLVILFRSDLASLLCKEDLKMET